MEYSRIHQSRVRKIDQEISELITNSCISEEQVATLKDMWTDDCAELEHRAAQTWLRTERFLNKKKHDDEKRQESTLTNMSWEETLAQRLKKKPPARQIRAQQYYARSLW